MSSRYDLAVIGAGSAGFWVAIAAAELGARVALIGHGTIGGTCVNISCMPSKNLIRATEALYHANNAARFDGMRARLRRGLASRDPRNRARPNSRRTGRPAKTRAPSSH